MVTENSAFEDGNMTDNDIAARTQLSRAGELFERRKYKEAFEVYSRLSRVGNVYAQIRLADMYATGAGVSTNLNAARELYASAAEEDYLPAKYSYAWFLIDKEPREAFARMSYAADAGYLPAVYWAGMMYYEGIGTDVDRMLGERYLNQAAEGGHVWAERYLIGQLSKTGFFGLIRALLQFIPLGLRAYRIHRTNPHDDRLRG